MFLSVNRVRIPPAPLRQQVVIPICNTCLVSLTLQYTLIHTNTSTFWMHSSYLAWMSGQQTWQRNIPVAFMLITSMQPHPAPKYLIAYFQWQQKIVSTVYVLATYSVLSLVQSWLVKWASASQISEFNFSDSRNFTNKDNLGLLSLMQPFVSDDMICWVVFSKLNYKM